MAHPLLHKHIIVRWSKTCPPTLKCSAVALKVNFWTWYLFC